MFPIILPIPTMRRPIPIAPTATAATPRIPPRIPITQAIPTTHPTMRPHIPTAINSTITTTIPHTITTGRPTIRPIPWSITTPETAGTGSGKKPTPTGPAPPMRLVCPFEQSFGKRKKV